MSQGFEFREVIKITQVRDNVTVFFFPFGCRLVEFSQDINQTALSS